MTPLPELSFTLADHSHTGVQGKDATVLVSILHSVHSVILSADLAPPSGHAYSVGVPPHVRTSTNQIIRNICEILASCVRTSRQQEAVSGIIPLDLRGSAGGDEGVIDLVSMLFSALDCAPSQVCSTRHCYVVSGTHRATTLNCTGCRSYNLCPCFLAYGGDSWWKPSLNAGPPRRRCI